MTVKGRKYYIGKKGYRVTGLKTIHNKKYYFNSKGVLIRNKISYKIKGKEYEINSDGVAIRVSSLKAECMRKAKKFVEKHTSPNMSNSQKFRICFNYLMGYTDFKPWINPTDAEFKTQTWPYQSAIYMFDNNLAGSCYGIASAVAACARVLGYEPYVIATTGDHGFVMIDGYIMITGTTVWCFYTFRLFSAIKGEVLRQSVCFKNIIFIKGESRNEKMEKITSSSLCAFMLQIPVIVNAEAVDSSNNVTSAVETPVATPTPALLDGIVKKGSRTYFYKNGVMQKNCWSPDKKQYFGKNGVAYAAPKVSGCKKNIVVKKIGKKYYGFDRNGFKVKKGVYADAKGTPYYFDKKGVRVAKKSNQLKAASKYMADGAVLRKLLGRPSKTKTLSSCMTGISKDLKLTYANIFVQLGKKTTGGEIVYGVQAR